MCAALYKWWGYREDKVIHSAGKNMPTLNSMLPVQGWQLLWEHCKVDGMESGVHEGFLERLTPWTTLWRLLWTNGPGSDWASSPRLVSPLGLGRGKLWCGAKRIKHMCPGMLTPSWSRQCMCMCRYVLDTQPHTHSSTSHSLPTLSFLASCAVPTSIPGKPCYPAKVCLVMFWLLQTRL